MRAWEGQATMVTTRTARRAVALIIGSIFVLGPAAARELSLDERATAAKSIEQVYHRHRIWPEGNPEPKPPLDTIAPEAAFRTRVAASLRESARLEAIRGHVTTGDELQAEIVRMVTDSKAPETLREIFAALDDDPLLIAECVARPALTARLLAAARAANPSQADAPVQGALDVPTVRPPVDGYFVPAFPAGGCTPDTWSLSSLTNATGANFPTARQLHTSIWTGAEMIVWGGWDGSDTAYANGGLYDPATDSWSSSTLTTGTGANVPAARYRHTAVWTGTEMIVWGGRSAAGTAYNTGGRYNPATDLWATTSLTTATGANVPSARLLHTAIWTGTEMIVWGGTPDAVAGVVNTGGRYAPASDSWATSVLTTGFAAFTPVARAEHSAVWTGTEMIVWGGRASTGAALTSGGRYAPDAWTNSNLTSSLGPYTPSARYAHTAVWTGSEMIVWGGSAGGGVPSGLNNGGRFDPATDNWMHSSLTEGIGANLPGPRLNHTAAWTGADMIIWGGSTDGSSVLNNGGRYVAFNDTWGVTSLTAATGANVPNARQLHTAVWTGLSDHRMIVWAGAPNTATGGLFCAACITRIWFADGDGDGYGVPTATTSSCTQPAGFAPTSNDCDDTNPAIHPGAAEICNGLDDDCDTNVDEGGSALCSDGLACTADVCDPTGCSAVHASANLDTTGFSAGRVDGLDLVVIADAWNACPGDLRYNAAANLDQGAALPDSCVDDSDFHLFMNSFGQSCP
jgi:hypothetical protein